MTPKYTIEFYDLDDQPDGCKAIGYRIVGEKTPLGLTTDTDFLVHSLSETLSHIGQVLPGENQGAHYPWPL